MITNALIYIVPFYLILVLAVVLAATHRRIALSRAFLISFFLTPVMGILALCRASRKVVVTYYNPLNRCTGCPFTEDAHPDVCENCELIGKLRDKLSVKRRFMI